MATAEERLQQIIGAYAFQVASMASQLEQAQARIKELEDEKNKDSAKE